MNSDLHKEIKLTVDYSEYKNILFISIYNQFKALPVNRWLL